MDFYDIGNLDLQQKDALFRARYQGKLRYAGKKHPVIEQILSLNNNSKPNPDRLAAVTGIWAMSLAQKYEVKMKYLIICLEQLKSIESQKLVDWFVERAQESYVVSPRVFNSIAETDNGQGVMGVLYLDFTELADFKPGERSLVLVLDGLEIPGNVGTILRSSEATGTEAVFFSNRKVRINHPKLLRSSQGSVFRVPLIDVANPEELIAFLRGQGYTIFLADTDSETKYFEPNYQGRVALVVGAERYGISEPFYKEEHEAVMIPMLGDMDSLNVGVAATILLYEAAMKNRGLLRR